MNFIYLLIRSEVTDYGTGYSKAETAYGGTYKER